MRTKEKLDQFTNEGLLIAPYLSAELAEYCRSIDLAFIDTAGNAYINQPELYIFVQGLKEENPQLRPRTETVMGSPSAMKIIFALLSRPNLITASFRTMAEEANVAFSMVGDILSLLERRGFLINSKSKKTRKLTHPLELLDEWIVSFSHSLIPKLNVRRFSCSDQHWWQSVQLDSAQAQWGGEIAAQRLTNYIKPASQTIYSNKEAMSTIMNTLVKKFRLRADPTGAIEMRERFWNFTMDSEYADVAPPALVYADLIATLDPRNAEVAKMIKEKFIDETFNQI